MRDALGVTCISNFFHSCMQEKHPQPLLRAFIPSYSTNVFCPLVWENWLDKTAGWSTKNIHNLPREYKRYLKWMASSHESDSWKNPIPIFCLKLPEGWRPTLFHYITETGVILQFKLNGYDIGYCWIQIIYTVLRHCIRGSSSPKQSKNNKITNFA